MLVKIRKYTWEQKKSSALSKIKKIEVLLHRHAFDGDYSYTELEERLGKIKVENRESKNYRSNSYRQTGYVWFNGYKLRVFWSRKNPSARCKIEVSGPRQEHQTEFQECLAKLNEALPNLHLDSVEYTLDLYCSNPTDVGRLFNVVVRYFHVPYTLDMHLNFPKSHSPNTIPSWKLNRTCHMQDWKIYERGDKDTNLRPGWHLRDNNRVRVELTADSDLLEKHGIIRLEDYVKDCHFENIFLPEFQFKVFRGSNLLPNENDSYVQKGGHESFQQHLIEIRERGRPKNPNQYKVDAPGFDELKEQVSRAIKKFDRDWRANYRKVLTRPITRTGKRREHS